MRQRGYGHTLFAAACHYAMLQPLDTPPLLFRSLRCFFDIYDATPLTMPLLSVAARCCFRALPDADAYYTRIY